MTELIYLSDTYLFSYSSTLQELWENEYGQYIILDRTIFYPQWGWQPSDIGTISDGKNEFIVDNVRMNEFGIVYHYGHLTNWCFTLWKMVDTSIDKENRITHARIHSAGHLIDIALHNIWVTLIPKKWYHFSDWPYVEYSGKVTESMEWIILKLQNELDKLIRENISIVISYTIEIKSPSWKNPRYVAYKWYEWCWCGGTHVRNTGEIGKITIRKIKMKDGNLRVSYSIEKTLFI